MAALAFAGDARPWQRSLRWARPAPDRRAVSLGIALALVLTAIEVGLFDAEMRREIARVAYVPPDSVLDVELIEEQAPVEAPVVIEIPPMLRRPVPAPVEHRIRQPAAPRQAFRESRPAPAPSQEKPRLFGLDGHVLIPDESQGHSTAPENLADGPAHGDAFARTNPVPYQATRFDKYFPDVRETLGDEIWRKTTVSHVWLTPWGSMIECKSNLLLLGIGGCGWGPAPRLSAEELKAIRAPDLPLPPPTQPTQSALQPTPPAANPPAAPDILNDQP